MLIDSDHRNELQVCENTLKCSVNPKLNSPNVNVYNITNTKHGSDTDPDFLWFEHAPSNYSTGPFGLGFNI